MIFPQEKMTSEFKELLDLKLREKVATDVNKAILEARGERAEAKIRQLVRARAWQKPRRVKRRCYSRLLFRSV